MTKGCLKKGSPFLFLFSEFYQPGIKSGLRSMPDNWINQIVEITIKYVKVADCLSNKVLPDAPARLILAS
jgi:hypothetical protein